MLVCVVGLFALRADDRGLKDYYRAYFPIGVAVAPRNLVGPEAELIVREFNSITPENAMKMGPIHPEEGRYYWPDADAIVDFAQRNKLKLRGHTLCWHNQTPPWFFTDAAGQPVSKDVLLARLKTHIQTVVSRYKGKIYAWDVVNEAVSDAGPDVYRQTKFHEIIGDEYLERAFQYAHEAEPNAVLFYNDYNTENPAKRERIYQVVKRLKEKGVPIGGVGLQGHWSIYEPTAAALEESITKFAGLGLAVQITELDVSVYAKEHQRRAKQATDQGEFTPELAAKQAAHYNMLFEVFRKHRGQLTGVTFWNVSDKSSWLDNFPVPGRKDYPLLFDQQYRRKKAYQEVITF